ncbi:hypothetical protein NHX12_028581 [Muraenolepis orangiensis]|uniref:Centrosomal protein POC5 n=1 Tax=Muraenolepis orangiensis TaxID=630683 RepID=A0A9Q0EAV0_9TELE|nr:hypothetical protein NHX12_028581 [Muraenolepis orangiensis]
MSSDEGGATSPVLPKDSDRGSSVSSELQDEYEELIRFAVVTPRFDGQAGAHLQSLPSTSGEAGRERHGKDDTTSPRQAVEELTGQSSGGTSGGPSDRSQAERSRRTSPDSWESGGTEHFISEENISKMEDILDTWSNHLKSNAAGLSAELGGLKDLLHTYETSNQRKDEVIMNLTKALDRQKEKMEVMRTFTTWRIRHSQAKEEVHAAKIAQQHYHLQLKRKVWLGWHGLLQKHWKDKVERACRARAEEVCVRLSSDYEARIAQHCEAVEDAQAEIQKLRVDRERYEESMKKAFMRGVCALNMEALTMFQPPAEDAPPPPDERGFSSLAQQQERPVSSARFSPVHFDPPAHPSHTEAGPMLGSSAPVTRPEASTAVIHSSLPLGGAASTHRQASGGRVGTTVVGQQKASKVVTARVTARPDLGRTSRSSLHVMSMTPPMSSVIVERHQPVTQHPPSDHLNHSLPATRAQSSSSRAHPSTCHTHSIKVVD